MSGVCILNFHDISLVIGLSVKQNKMQILSVSHHYTLTKYQININTGLIIKKSLDHCMILEGQI